MVRGDFSRDCGTTNISVATKCGSIRLVGRRVGEALASKTVSSVNNFNKLFSLGSRVYSRPVLMDNASNMNAGLGVTVLLSGRSAVNVSYITVYMGSIVYYNTGPLFFLSCVTYKGGCPRGVTSVMSNITRNYIETNYTLVNNRATRRPNVVPRSSCSLTKFAMNVIGGPSMFSGGSMGTNSIVVTLPSDNMRSGKFSLIEGMFSFSGNNVSGACSRLNSAVNRTLLAPARVCMGPILTLTGRIGVGTMSRVANNNFCRGVPEDLPRNVATIVRGGTLGVLPMFSVVRGANGVPRESVFGAFGVNIKVDVAITPRSTSETMEVLRRDNASTCVVNRATDNRSNIGVY